MLTELLIDMEQLLMLVIYWLLKATKEKDKDSLSLI